MEPGARLCDRYVVETLIGEGAIGRVFSALDERTQKHVAVKINVRGADDTQERSVMETYFEREQKALMLIDHPGVLRLFDRGRDDEGRPFVVTELLRGKSFQRILEHHGPLEENVFAAVAEKVMSALAAAHKAGIVHRDLKPENIFLCDDGRVVILDFGVARGTAASGSHTMAKGVNTQLVGTAHYLSPEQLQGVSLSARSDLFSLGSTFYALLTGQPPYSGVGVIDVYQAILTNNRRFLHAVLPKLHPQTTALVEKLLAFDPNERPEDARAAYPLASALLDQFPGAERALKTYAAKPTRRREETTQVDITAPNTVIATAPSTSISTRPSVVRRSRAPVWIMAAIVLAGAAVALAWVLRPKKPAIATTTIVDAIPVATDVELRPGAAPEVPEVPELPPSDPAPAPATPKTPKRKPAPELVAPPKAPQGPGVLMLQLKQWAFVTIDGEAKGKKQLAARFELPAGKHTLVATNPAFGELRQTLSVSPTQETQFVVDFTTLAK